MFESYISYEEDNNLHFNEFKNYLNELILFINNYEKKENEMNIFINDLKAIENKLIDDIIKKYPTINYCTIAFMNKITKTWIDNITDINHIIYNPIDMYCSFYDKLFFHENKEYEINLPNIDGDHICNV